MKNNKKYTIQDCIDLATSKGRHCLSITYTNMNDKMQWKCKCGYIWYSDWNHIYNRNQWCIVCSGHKKLSLQDCIDFANSKDGKCLSDKYINVDTRMLWQCKNYHQWYSTLYDVKNRER